jgi:hypothetical protein
MYLARRGDFREREKKVLKKNNEKEKISPNIRRKKKEK